MSNQGSVFPPGHTRPPDNVVETLSSKQRKKEDEDSDKSSAEGLEVMPDKCSVVDVKTNAACRKQTVDAMNVSAAEARFRTGLDYKQTVLQKTLFMCAWQCVSSWINDNMEAAI